MTKEELFKKSFTQSQLDWLAAHPSNAKASSDMESLANAAAALFAADQYGSVKDKQNLAKLMDKGSLSYDLESLASTASKKFTGFEEDGKKVSGAEQFLNAFFGDENGNGKETDKAERDKWRVRIKEEYGDEGWENAKKVLQNAAVARMDRKIAKDRASVMEGYDPETGDVNPLDWAESAFMGIFAPRQKKAYKEGREPTLAEEVMDAGSNVAYSLIPTGKIGAAIAGPAAGLGKRVLGAVASNAVAPAAVAAGDLVTGAKDYAGVKDFATDVGLGTLTNLGVNKGLAAVGSRAIPFLLGQTKAEKGSAKVLRDMLDGKPTAKEAAEGQVDEATRRAKDALKTKAELSPEAEDQLLDDLLVTEFGRIVKNDKAYAKELRQNIKDANELASERNTDAYMLVGKDPLWQIDALTALRNRVSNNKILETKVSGRNMNHESYEPPLDDNIWSFLDDVPGDETIVRETLRRHPELENLVTPESVKRKAAYAAKDFAVNKYGSDSDASKVLALVPGLDDPKQLRKEQEKARQAKREARAAQVLDLSDYDPEDQKYLSIIKNKPEVLRGIGKEAHDPKFKNWLLLRGQDILRGTELFRPTPTVE